MSELEFQEPIEDEIAPIVEAVVDDMTLEPDNGKFQTLVDYCFELYDTFRKSSYRKSKLKEIKESRRIYEQISTKTNFPYKDAPNIILPLLMITIDNLEPRIVAGLIGKEPFVQLEIEGGGKDDLVKVISEWFNQELKNKILIKNATMQIVHNLLLEGTVFPIPKWDKTEFIQRDFVYDEQGQIILNERGTPALQDIPVLKNDSGKIELVAFNDILCADDIGTIEEWEAADKIRIIRPTYGELVNKKDSLGYINIGTWLISHEKERKLTGGGGSRQDDDVGITPSQEIAGVEYTGKEVIDCLEFHISYYMFKDEEAPPEEQRDFTEDRLIVTIARDSKKIIRIVKQRELNFFNESLIKRIRLYPENARTYGTSVYGKIGSIQNGASELFNIVLACAYILMLPWFFYQDSAGLKGTIELIPGKGIPCDDVEGVKFPTFNINITAFESFIQIFINLWERAGNISNPQIGRPTDTQKTATEIMSSIQEGNIKFNYQAEITRDEFIVLLKTLFDLYYQYMPFNKQFTYGGEQVQIPRQAMKRGYKFTLSGSSDMANKLIERKEAEDLFQMTAGNPIINPFQTVIDLLQAYGKTDVKSYINPELFAMLQSIIQNPEIPSLIKQYLSTKPEESGVQRNAG